MKNTLLTAASMVAIVAAVPAMAEEARTSNQQDQSYVTQEEMEQGWEDTKDAVSETAEDVSDAAKETYQNAKQAVMGDENQANKIVKINKAMTASGMIGQPVYDGNGDRVAKIKDIILDGNGNATMVVLGDGDFTGLGKTVAYDYNVITRRTNSGDIISPLTEDEIDRATAFSYDPEDRANNVKVMPENGFSVAEILDGQLQDPQENTLAQIDNVTFENGKANQLIVGFDKTLGMGGEQAVMSFKSAQLVHKSGKVNAKLNANEAQQFNAFKKSAFN